MLESYQIEKIKNRNSILSYSSLTVEEQAVFYIYEDLNNIKKNFVDIAFRLNEANNYKYYEKFGYENIVDFSEHLFGFKKSSTYSFINIAQRFCCGMHLSPKYEKFSQSQLTEMCSLPEYLLEHVTSDMTVQDIRDYKKAYNSLTVIDNTYKEPKVLIERYRNSNSIELKDNSIEDNSRRLEETSVVKEVKNGVSSKDVDDCLKSLDKLMQPSKIKNFLSKQDKLLALFNDEKYFKEQVYDKVKYFYKDFNYELKICGTERDVGFLIHSFLNVTFDVINQIIKE